MILVGIDPGKEGAIVRLAEDAQGRPDIEVTPMPVIQGEKREEYDIKAIQLALLLADHVFIEKLHPMPLEKGGTIANYNRGFCMGLLQALCVARTTPYTLVRPQEWQREMLAGTPGEDAKQKSIIAAQRLFPGVDLRRTSRCKTLSDGISDALLIAAWGQRRLNGGK